MQPVTRFAPSPTGRLHLGHAYSALLAHDHARDRGGTFLLRIEDIDRGRARPEFVDAILEDLLWLGLEWDGEIAYQSERLDLYSAALEKLAALGVVYRCFCTRADIAASVAAPQGPEGPLYPGTCRGREQPGGSAERPHALRLDAAKSAELVGSLAWMEGDRSVSVDPQRLGDVVFARKDAPASYHLAVTVDDAAQGVTDVVRGRDLFASTHVHRLLQALLGLPAPLYHHHRLLADRQGRRLAKRHGAPTLADLRASGVDGLELAARLRAGQMPGGYSLADA